MKTNSKIWAIGIAATSMLIAGSAKAVCPICTVAVGAGVGFSRWLGIDDTVTGLWVGGLTVSMIMWTISWMDKKNFHFMGRKILTVVGYYALIVAPLYWMGIMGHPFNTLWGMDKLLLGTIIGSVGFFLGGIWYYRIKAKNGGHSFFPFQKVVMPISPLIILSIFFYFLTK
ncbi:MAG: hypothetical protein WCV59_03880 [Parcubacteria group bacterium]|jgi:hypothetical protein